MIIIATTSDKKYCGHCNRTLKKTEFYASNNKEKYPDGFYKECKKCAAMHVNPYDTNTFLYLLQEIDVPWIPEEWSLCIDQVLRANGNDAGEVTAQAVLGRYFAHMRLTQYRHYRWKDTEILQQKKEEEMRQALQFEHYTDEEIEDKIASKKTLPEQPDLSVTYSQNEATDRTQDVYAKKIEQEKYFEEQLTDENRVQLLLKWGPEYNAQEWVQLEQLYNDMMASYDIQTAGHKDTLKLACKASLKTHELLNCGDIDGALKASRMYDTLMKSGKFQPVQNKNDSNNVIDSIGELVALCETDGYIEKYYISSPKDKVDQVLEDYKDYVRYLVETEENLGSLIESSAKILAQQEHDNALAANGEDDSDDILASIEEDISTPIPTSTIEEDEYEDTAQAIENLIAASRPKNEKKNISSTKSKK